MATRIAINGFGRIGRVSTRALLGENDSELVAINDLMSPQALAHLFKYDSVHGVYPGEVSATDDAIIVDGHTIKVTAERDPANLPWAANNIDVVYESTGLFRDKASAGKHLAGGAKWVIISAPAKDPDITVVMGVNETKLDPAQHKIISNASCTTNCLAPVAKVLNDNWGIAKGLMTTIHSYTNDQVILDGPHKDLRRARAGALSMIPTSTGAAKAVTLVLPELQGRLDGFAIRVPTPNVSVVDLSAVLEKDATADDINAAMKAAADGPLKGYLAYNTEPLVSCDFNGTPFSSIFDGTQTRVQQGNLVKVLSWYDNECGYSNRMVDLGQYLVSKAG